MTTKNPKQREVWWVNFSPSTGAEIKKKRPAVVVGTDGVGKLPLRLVVPITDWKSHYEEYRWHVFLEADNINGLQKDSSADTLQIKSVAIDRFIEKSGRVSAAIAEELKHTLAIVLDIPTK